MNSNASSFITIPVSELFFYVRTLLENRHFTGGSILLTGKPLLRSGELAAALSPVEFLSKDTKNSPETKVASVDANLVGNQKSPKLRFSEKKQKMKLQSLKERNA